MEDENPGDPAAFSLDQRHQIRFHFGPNRDHEGPQRATMY